MRFVVDYSVYKCRKPALELLPYHTMGRSKYQNLGIEYPLEGVQQMDKANIPLCKTWVLEGIKERRAELVGTN